MARRPVAVGIDAPAGVRLATTTSSAPVRRTDLVQSADGEDRVGFAALVER